MTTKLTVILIVSCLAFIAALFLINKQYSDFDEKCKAEGNRVQYIYRNANCISPDGKLVDTRNKGW